MPQPQAAELEVDGFQVQNLAELVPKLLAASAGYGLRFRIGVALEANAPESVRRQVDDMLKETVPNLKSDARAGPAI